MPPRPPKIPPLLVVAFLVLFMWLAAHFVPACGVTMPARRVIAATLALLGLAICVAGVRSFRRARTTVNPMKPDTASSLVTSGIYRHTRNPMYLGFLLALTAFAVSLSNVLAFLGPIAFFLHMNTFQIPAEERALASLFGDSFVAYKSRVRRWL